MRRTILLFLCLIILTQCKKAIQEREENAIMKAMTDGQWKITSFSLDSVDVTSQFASYKFQYFSNYTVQAIKNGTVENTGSWEGDINTMSISANFSDAVNPILLLNGTWLINDNSWTYVKATLTNGNEVRKLRLDKQ